MTSYKSSKLDTLLKNARVSCCCCRAHSVAVRGARRVCTRHAFPRSVQLLRKVRVSEPTNPMVWQRSFLRGSPCTGKVSRGLSPSSQITSSYLLLHGEDRRCFSNAASCSSSVRSCSRLSKTREDSSSCRGARDARCGNHVGMDTHTPMSSNRSSVLRREEFVAFLRAARLVKA